MIIRSASRDDDAEGIRSLYLTAFAEQERYQVASLATDLLDLVSQPATLSLVAQSAGSVVGHVAFSPVWVDKLPGFSGFILAPLAVLPLRHNQRIGSRLVEHGLAMLGAADVVFVYGDPNYYARFGFDARAALDYLPPYDLEYPLGWQARVLKPADESQAPVAMRCVAPLDDPALW